MTKKSCKYVFADVSLLAVAAIWGLTFVTVKNAIVLLPPFAFNFYRFGLAALVMLLVAIPQRHRIELTTVKAGFLLGIFLFAGYSFQTVGLFYTSASNTGFITGLSVVCVPLFSTLISKAWPGMGVVIGAVSATIGLFFISGGSVSNFNIGDFLVLFCAISFALHIIFVGKFAVLHSTVWLVTVQIATVSLLSGISTLFLEAGNNTFVSAVWPA
ncbi:MAG: DMT family transporter, partial [Firmicutes bacterium]|nr:DMT family transporter [Bacillota bacterium]